MKSIDEISAQIKESNDVDFKGSFDPNSGRDWCEIIKDIAAMANSGGGAILVGVKDNGEPSGHDVTEILNLDQADIVNKVSSYTDEQFSKIDVRRLMRGEHLVAAFIISSSDYPIVFKKPGTYDIGGGKQDRAFSVGSIYFRHGTTSEYCRASDIRDFIDRKVTSIKSSWLEGIRQVVEAPEGSHVVVHTVHEPTEIRFTDDPNAVPTRLEEKELVELYPLDYPQLTNMLRLRYKDFSENFRFWAIKKSLEVDPKYCYVRFLNPKNKRGGMKRLYSFNIVNELDKHYSLRS